MPQIRGFNSAFRKRFDFEWLWRLPILYEAVEDLDIDSSYAQEHNGIRGSEPAVCGQWDV